MNPNGFVVYEILKICISFFDDSTGYMSHSDKITFCYLRKSYIATENNLKQKKTSEV